MRMAICFFVLAVRVVAAEPVRFHVAPEGRDDWSGRIGTHDGKQDGPFATPARAARALAELRRAGGGKLSLPVNIEFAAGTYSLADTLVFTAEHSGSESAPVTWMARDGQPVIFSGGAVITGWREVELNGRKIWTAKGPGNFFRSLWVGNQPRVRSRFPNREHLKLANKAAPETPWDEGGFVFKYKQDAIPAFTIDDAEVVAFNRWVESRLPVIRNDQKLRQLRFSKRTIFRPGYEDLYRIENAPEFLDEPGEWFLRKATGEIFYFPMPGEQIEKFQAIAPHLAQLVRLDGKPETGASVEHLTFKGITFSHTEWSLPPPNLDETGKPARGGFVQAAHGVPGAVWANAARHCAFESCTFTHLGSYGLELGRACQGNRVSRCTFTDLGAGGIRIGDPAMYATEAEHTRGNEVTDCTISHYGTLFTSGCGIFVGQSYGNRFAHNLIHDGHYTGISIGWTWGYEPSQARDNIIEHNHVHHIGKLSSGDGPVLSDMGAIYLLGPQPGTVIRMNRFHDVAGREYGGWGIYFDEGTSQVLAETNVVYNTTHGGFHQHYGRDNILRNNIFGFGRDRQIERSKSEAHQSYSFERNIVIWNRGTGIAGNWDTYNATFRLNQYAPYGAAEPQFAYQSFEQWQAKGMDKDSVLADPGFVDAEKGDFRFKQGAGPAAGIKFESWDLDNVGPRRAN
jgi:hypothetical protein